MIESSIPIWDILSPEQLEENKKQANLHFKNGINYNKKNNYEEACIEFTKSCELYPTNDLVFLHWGNALFDMAKLKNDEFLYEQSVDKFQIATELNSKNDLAFYNWGHTIFNLAKLRNSMLLYVKSFELFQRAVEINTEIKSTFYDFEVAIRMKNVPKEIWEHGAAAVVNYLEEINRHGVKKFNEARILILGDKGVGKTCIARRLIDPDAAMTTDAESTAGVNTIFWKLEHENFYVDIWDFSGHTVTHAVHPFFLSERGLYLMVYNGRTEERNRLEYWLDHMKNYGGDSQAMILVNQRDQHSVDIPVNFLKEKYPIVGIFTFSIKDDAEGLAAFRKAVVGYIKNNPSWENQVFPSNYYQVKDELENLFAKGEQDQGQEHITKDEFDKIAEKYDVDNKEELLQALHFLGVSLWYKDMEAFDTLVLNPEWISHGVYKIINWVNEAKRYSLTLDNFKTVFAEDAKRYPESKHAFLFKLMKHYELAFETKAGKELIIPHLLNEDRLATLPDFPVGESLMLRYKAEQPLPPNTISRFIVRHNQEIKKEQQDYLVWRYGVILQDHKGSLALVREEDRTISVAVKGNDKTNYIDALRATLNDIFNSYKSDKPELQYRIERSGEILSELEERNPLWLPGRKILNQSNDNVPYYEDMTGKYIDLHETVRNYNINAENLMLEG